MEPIFKYLPLELVVYILEFDCSIKYRNGKFFNQILKKDNRYEMLKKVSPIKKNFLFNTNVLCYTRDLGKYLVYLHINKAYGVPRHSFTIQKKIMKINNKEIDNKNV
jgi:hypothetical protein